MNSSDIKVDYPLEVVYQIEQDQKEDYNNAAEFINKSDFDIVSVQHEFGIFGGASGSNIVELLGRLEKPVITTLHTILPNPSELQKKTLIEIAAFSRYIIVMSSKAFDILEEVYSIPLDKVRLIYHGIPDVPFIDSEFYKNRIEMTDKKIVLTYGFLSPGKGLEVMIKAMQYVVKTHPDTLYLILGVTHPEVKNRSGEEYRESLVKLTKQLGLENHIIFQNDFVDNQTLTTYLGAADVMVCPYHNEDQISSGVLSSAIGMGKAVVSTPFLYARDILGNGIGILANFRDHTGIAEAVNEILSNEKKKINLGKKAYVFSREMTWNKVAKKYSILFEQTIDEIHKKLNKDIYPVILPYVNLDYLYFLTDDTSIIHHAYYGVPNRDCGYSTDDAGRALAVSSEYLYLFDDSNAINLINKYLSFLQYVQREDGWFHNIVNYRREFEDEKGSEDTLGRCIWGLGSLCKISLNLEEQKLAKLLLDKSSHLILDLKSPRALAYCGIGLSGYIQNNPEAIKEKRILFAIADRLIEHYHDNVKKDWLWFEEILTYDNARLPEVLLLANKHRAGEETLEVALASLDFLTSLQYKEGYFDLIGNEGWYSRGSERACFGQQPIEAAALVQAYMLAHMTSGNEKYIELALSAFQWFLGRNRFATPLYNPKTGACADGIDVHGISENKGSESTLSFLMALLNMYNWEIRDKFKYRDKVSS
ncbi:MAG TPA: glycosyltransferase [Halanaerobiales bacterium]|nr:glycosyltransferase [Halanaerobiales bacterium]